MSVGGGKLKTPQSAVIRTPENPLNLRGHATFPSPQLPKPLDRVRPAIGHQEIPEPGFPDRYAPTSFDRSFTAYLLEDGYLSAAPPARRRRDADRSTAQASDIRTVPVCVQRTGRQELLGHKDVSTTMIYTHVLNRGPAAVRSLADRLLTSSIPPEEIGCKILQPSSAAFKPPAMGRANYIQPGPAHPQNSDEGNRLQLPAALKEIDRSVYF